METSQETQLKSIIHHLNIVMGEIEQRPYLSPWIIRMSLKVIRFKTERLVDEYTQAPESSSNIGTLKIPQ